MGVKPFSSRQRVNVSAENRQTCRGASSVTQRPRNRRAGQLVTLGVSISNQGYIAAFCSNIVSNPDVLECHHVTGEESFILKVKIANTASLEELLAYIRSMEGVTRTVTKVVLSTPREGHILVLDEEPGGIARKGRKLAHGQEEERLKK